MSYYSYFDFKNGDSKNIDILVFFMNLKLGRKKWKSKYFYISSTLICSLILSIRTPKFGPRGILTRTEQLWARSPPVHSLSVLRLIDEGQVTMGTAFSLVKIFSKREQDIFYEFIKQKHSESFE